MLRRLYPDLLCHCLLPCLARDRMFRLRSLVVDVAHLSWACFFGGMSTLGEWSLRRYQQPHSVSQSACARFLVSEQDEDHHLPPPVQTRFQTSLSYPQWNPFATARSPIWLPRAGRPTKLIAVLRTLLNRRLQIHVDARQALRGGCEGDQAEETTDTQGDAANVPRHGSPC